jgi:sec-independent protein translocase protein TatC
MAITATGEAARGRMPLLAHLIELRRRLLVAAIAVVAGAVIGWFLSADVLDALRAPLVEFARSTHRLATLNYDSISGAFDLRFRIALYLGFALSSPAWLSQIWAFVVPALTRRERRYAVGFLGTAIPLFLGGCAAGWLVVPHMVLLLTSFAPAGSASLVQASNYVDFVLKLVLAIGVAFVLPLFLVLLDLVGVLGARTILRGWRVAVLAVVGFTALVTPSADVVSMCLLALPMLGLYFAAAGVAALHDRRVASRLAIATASFDRLSQ